MPPRPRRWPICGRRSPSSLSVPPRPWCSATSTRTRRSSSSRTTSTRWRRSAREGMTMVDDRTLAYAEALFGVARAEGTLGEVEDELFRFSQTLHGSDELREALTDPGIPAARRQQVVEDLLGGRASPTTVALVSMVVGTGRARSLPTI